MPRKSSAALAFAPGSADRIRPPPDLDGDARKTFIDLVIGSKAGHFTQTDAPLLATYARAIVQERTASAGLQADGYVSADGKPSPWLPVLAQATRVMSTYSRMLRLNPSARSAPSSSESEGNISYYERLAMEKRNGERESH